jgi:hypothetical protein
MFKKRIPLPIYETVINLFVVPTIDHMQAYLDKKANAFVDVSDSYGCVFSLGGAKGTEYYIVYVEDKISTNLISHEIYHLATNILTDISIKDEESTAWLVGHLTEKIYRILRQKKYNIKE